MFLPDTSGCDVCRVEYGCAAQCGWAGDHSGPTVGGLHPHTALHHDGRHVGPLGPLYGELLVID